MAKAKQPKYTHNRPFTGPGGKVHMVRAWKERRQHVVQVWLDSTSPDCFATDPTGDWEMPGALPLVAAIEQAILNTEDDQK